MGNAYLIVFFIINCVTPTGPTGKRSTPVYELFSLLTLLQVAKSRREKMVVFILFSSLLSLSLPWIFPHPPTSFPSFFPPFCFFLTCFPSIVIFPPVFFLPLLFLFGLCSILLRSKYLRRYVSTKLNFFEIIFKFFLL